MKNKNKEKNLRHRVAQHTKKENPDSSHVQNKENGKKNGAKSIKKLKATPKITKQPTKPKAKKSKKSGFNVLHVVIMIAVWAMIIFTLLGFIMAALAALIQN